VAPAATGKQRWVGPLDCFLAREASVGLVELAALAVVAPLPTPPLTPLACRICFDFGAKAGTRRGRSPPGRPVGARGTIVGLTAAALGLRCRRLRRGCGTGLPADDRGLRVRAALVSFCVVEASWWVAVQPRLMVAVDSLAAVPLPLQQRRLQPPPQLSPEARSG
jgi:hypothetical protein